MSIWSNWSGSLKFTPRKTVKPETEEELCALVKRAAEERKTVRVVGAGHSSSALAATDKYLVSMENFKGVEAPDNEQHRATVLSGMTIHEAGKELLKNNLFMHNTGDVDVQTVAGAIGTGTHGTGKNLKNLSTMLAGVRMVTGTGEIAEFSIENDKKIMQALRVALGSCGIFVKMRLQLLPKYKLDRKEWCAEIEPGLEHLNDLIEKNRNFDFYWYPRSDMVKLRTNNLPGKGTQEIPDAYIDKEMNGWSNEILPRKRSLKFDEMEYSLPAEAGLECFQEIRKEVKRKHRKTVGWRILYRTVAADDSYLSTCYKRDTVTISLHQNAGLPFWDYFRAIEPIFRAHGGRPHWGKKHTLKAPELKPLYPEWDKFMNYRKQFDPEDVFLSPYMQELFGIKKQP